MPVRCIVFEVFDTFSVIYNCKVAILTRCPHWCYLRLDDLLTSTDGPVCFDLIKLT
jgi:hypothetical protein